MLVDGVDFVVFVNYLEVARDVLVAQPFEDVEFIVEHVQTVGELTISCKEPLFLEPLGRTDLHRVLFSSRPYPQDLPEGSPSQLPHHLVLVVQLHIVGAIASLQLVSLHRDGLQGRVLPVTQGGCVEQSQLLEVVQFLLHAFPLQITLQIRHQISIISLSLQP